MPYSAVKDDKLTEYTRMIKLVKCGRFHEIDSTISKHHMNALITIFRSMLYGIAHTMSSTAQLLRNIGDDDYEYIVTRRLIAQGYHSPYIRMIVKHPRGEMPRWSTHAPLLFHPGQRIAHWMDTAKHRVWVGKYDAVHNTIVRKGIHYISISAFGQAHLKAEHQYIPTSTSTWWDGICLIHEDWVNIVSTLPFVLITRGQLAQ